MTISKQKHACKLNLGSDSMLPKKNTKCGQALRSMRKLGQLTKHHPETFEYFRSYSAVVAERQRLVLEQVGNVIHPLSLISMIWLTFMAVVNIVHVCISIFRLAYLLDGLDHIHAVDHGMLALYAICLLDIIMKFNTGYIDTKHVDIVMDRKLIACHYLRSWFIVDLVSCVPTAYILLYLKMGPRYILIAHLLPILRTSRLCTVNKDLKTFMRLFTDSYITLGLWRILIAFVVSAHWWCCLLYLPAVTFYYWTGEFPTQYNYYMRDHTDQYDQRKSHLLQFNLATRYNTAIVIVMSAFCGTGFTVLRSTEPEEILVHSCIIVYAAMFMVFFLVFLIKSYLTIFGSTMRYYGLMNQVEEYMTYRQFPLDLKKRVRAFYQYRYQERYFKEEADLDCLSEELRDEIRLHTCRTLVHKVKLFEDVPASVVGTVLGCLRPEVYLSNDLVVRAGDIGDCMYFISTGTVAVYSLKGVEVCHLEDGSHFGEVALLMKDSKRVATVVAVEITQLYRLDAIDFNRFMLSNPTLYERIEALASRRMHETVLLDDEFRRGGVSEQQSGATDVNENIRE